MTAGGIYAVEKLPASDLISAALCSVLHGLAWSVAAEVIVIQGVDPLEEMSRGS